MNEEESKFLCLKILVENTMIDARNAGWYIHRAFMLGEGCSVEEALETPSNSIPVRKQPRLYVVPKTV